MPRQVRLFLEMIRFSHTLFALPFAALSALLAWHYQSGHWVCDALGILLCMVFARSAAMGFNRLADRHLDAANPRTARRHLPARLLRPGQAWTFSVVSGMGFLASTLIFWFTGENPWPVLLAMPVLTFICAYSWTKRFTALCHFWLGASLMLAPLSAWIAILGMTRLAAPLVLGFAVLAWVAGFDILYACQDVDFDRKARLHSVPARWGIPVSLWIAGVCHMVMVCLLVGLWWVASPPLGAIYLGGVAAVALLLIYEHSIMRPHDLSRVNQAFFQVNGIISVWLFLVVAVQLAVGAPTAPGP